VSQAKETANIPLEEFLLFFKWIDDDDRPLKLKANSQFQTETTKD
jgi:hypothetical protein